MSTRWACTSQAYTRPVPPIYSAMAAALPPGAAQASSTFMPGLTITACAASSEGALCTLNSPAAKAGSRARLPLPAHGKRARYGAFFS